ncbi:11471_t:CDS:2, partial [Cetraspora pellucida]
SSSFSKVKHLSIDHCNLDGSALAKIFSLIAASTNYETVRVWAGGNYVSRASSGHREFCNAIANDWTPVWLSLEDTVYGTTIDNVVEILTSFCNNKVIKYLDLSCPQIKISKNVAFSLQDFMTAEKACAVIGKILKDNKCIKELNLRGEPDKQWGPSLGVQLTGLKTNNTLEKLNISGNSINGSDVRLLNEVLKFNSRLKYLSIDENMALEFQEHIQSLEKRLSMASRETFGTEDHILNKYLSSTKNSALKPQDEVENGKNGTHVENMEVKVETMNEIKFE